MYQRIDVTVRHLDPDNPDQLAEVCQLVRERGLKEALGIVNMIHEGNRKEAENARAVAISVTQYFQIRSRR